MRNNFCTGKILHGRYKTLCLLNHGSFGMVFQARDIITDNIVALKCLTKPMSNPSAAPLAVDDRSEELTIHKLVNSHPNIVNLIHHFQTEHHVYLVLEFCPKGDLYEAIRAGRGPVQTEKVREAMLQLIESVEFMHSRGVYHRDIKPENIFLSDRGEFKLGDFGLATRDTVSYESAVGSDRYMAPEQMEPSNTGYSPAKADVWAIGICLLNILFARNPFASPSVFDQLYADFAADKQSLFDIFPNMSQDTFDILMHCLAIDPENRSLAGAREAVQKAISFTTDDESFDEFSIKAGPVAATINREPLRTPSITSPQMDQGAFPWASSWALQLPAIADEDLSSHMFSESQPTGWFNGPTQTARASGVSLVDSGLGVSIKSSNLGVDVKTTASQPVPIFGSLPASMARPIPSMRVDFGKKRGFESKSWSDMCDEEFDMDDLVMSETENENSNIFFGHKHTLSDASNGSDTPRAGLSEVKNKDSVNNARDRTPPSAEFKIDDRISEQTGFLFEDHTDATASSSTSFPPATNTNIFGPLPKKYAPPPKRTIMDKWAALGDRRRGTSAVTTTTSVSAQFGAVSVKPVSIPSRKRSRAISFRKPGSSAAWTTAANNWSNQQSVPSTIATGNHHNHHNWGPTPTNYSPDFKKEWDMNKNWRNHDRSILANV
jgi:serine/threonine protein kinase